MSAPKADDGDARVSVVVVVGSLHYDIMVDAPDRPRKGETVAGHSRSPKFGGKGGNQALAAQSQGVPTAMVGAVGNDDFGTGLLAGRGVDRSAVATLSGVGSGMSVAIFDAEGDYGPRTASMRSGRTATRATGPRSAQPGRTKIKSAAT
jgi:ribokinase